MDNVMEAAPYWSGHGTPADFGRLMAIVAMRSEIGLEGLSVDLRGLPPALLVGNLFSGFLQQVYDRDPGLLEQARKTAWITDHDFQRESATSMMEGFVPRND